MHLTLHLSPEEEARLRAVARRRALAPEEYARQLLTSQLPAVDENVIEKNAASIALLQSWLAEAPADPEAIEAAEEDLREFKRHMNQPRKEAGARLLYPEVE